MRLAVQIARRLLLCLSLAAAGLVPAAAAGERDTLTIGLSQFPSTLNPFIDSMLAKQYVLAMATRPVVEYDHDWTLACMLCTGLPTFENGDAERVDLGDGKTGVRLTYRLHPEARWGDGTPVTSADVLFTLRMGKHPRTGVTGQEFFRRVVDAEAVDDKTFRVTIDRVTFDYNSFRMPLLPAHIEEKIFDEDPEKYRLRTRYDTDPSEPGLYNGPYRIVRLVRGSHIVLERNPHWHGRTPHFRRIVVRTIDNTSALEATLLAGGIDLISGDLGLTVDQALAFERRNKGRFDVEYKAGLIYEHVDVNLDDPILADRRVRQALMYGLDRKTMVEALFRGTQPVAHSNISPLDWIAADDIPTYGFDPDRARALLEEAGWTELRGGIRHDAKGRRLQVTLMTTAGNRSRELVQQVLQSYWRRIGVDVRIRNEPARVFFGQTVTRRNYRHLAMYAWMIAPESVPRSTLHSDQIPSAENGWAGQNYPGYRNPEMDELLDAIERELDRDKRQVLWRRLQEIYARDLPALPLFWRANAYIVPHWLKGKRPTGHLGTTTLWVEDWHVDEGAAVR